MNCIFNLCEFYNGLFLGVLSSAIVSVLTIIIVNSKNRKRLKIKYGKAEGSYSGYGFDGEKWILSDEVISQATIKYLRDNILTIEVRHNNLMWEGEILMETETLGSMAWKYSNLPKEGTSEQHRFGFKRCIVREEQNNQKTFVYLIGEESEGYGKEVFIKNRS